MLVSACASLVREARRILLILLFPGLEDNDSLAARLTFGAIMPSLLVFPTDVSEPGEPDPLLLPGL